jgi:hypothetical protein
MDAEVKRLGVLLLIVLLMNKPAGVLQTDFFR